MKFMGPFPSCSMASSSSSGTLTFPGGGGAGRGGHRDPVSPAGLRLPSHPSQPGVESQRQLWVGEVGSEGRRRPVPPQQAPRVSRGGSWVGVGVLTQLGIGLPKVRLADDAVTVLVDAAEGLGWGPQSPGGGSPHPSEGAVRECWVWEEQGQGPGPPPGKGCGGRCWGGPLTSLNSWIWACSNMEKTLEEPRWACLVAAALPRVPAFLLACNSVGGEGSSPGLPQDAPCTPQSIPRRAGLRVLSPPLEAQARQAQESLPCSPTPRTAPGCPHPGPHHRLSVAAWWPRGPQPPLCLSLITCSTK